MEPYASIFSRRDSRVPPALKNMRIKSSRLEPPDINCLTISSLTFALPVLGFLRRSRRIVCSASLLGSKSLIATVSTFFFRNEGASWKGSIHNPPWLTADYHWLGLGLKNYGWLRYKCRSPNGDARKDETYYIPAVFRASTILTTVFWCRYMSMALDSITPFLRCIYILKKTPAHQTTAFRTPGHPGPRPPRTGVGARDGESPDFGEATCHGQFSFKLGGWPKCQSHIKNINLVYSMLLFVTSTSFFKGSLCAG